MNGNVYPDAPWLLKTEIVWCGWLDTKHLLHIKIWKGEFDHTALCQLPWVMITVLVVLQNASLV